MCKYMRLSYFEFIRIEMLVILGDLWAHVSPPVPPIVVPAAVQGTTASCTCPPPPIRAPVVWPFYR